MFKIISLALVSLVFLSGCTLFRPEPLRVPDDIGKAIADEESEDSNTSMKVPAPGVDPSTVDEMIVNDDGGVDETDFENVEPDPDDPNSVFIPEPDPALIEELEQQEIASNLPGDWTMLSGDFDGISLNVNGTFKTFLSDFPTAVTDGTWSFKNGVLVLMPELLPAYQYELLQISGDNLNLFHTVGGTKDTWKKL